MATGTGKSLVIATVCHEIIDAFPETRILCVTHTRELIKQNFQELKGHWPAAPAGINCSGLKCRDWRSQILIASVQSIYKNMDILGKFDLVIIDEAHLMGRAANGMYQKLIHGLREGKPKMRILGLTATPFRLDSGSLTKGKNALFEKVIYKYGMKEGIRDGFLSDMIPKAMAAEIDTKKVKKRGGDFITADLAKAAMRQDKVRRACEEIVEYGAERRAWLVFCINIKHAEAVLAEMIDLGVSAAMVTGETPKTERDAIIRSFAGGELKAVVNVGVLTTGFNVPHTDLIALLRPTESVGLAIQMIGRGSRIAEGKENCLVLDFGRLLKTHGPIDQMEGREPSVNDGEFKEKEKGELVKICPECNAINPRAASECKQCAEKFEIQEREWTHTSAADGESPLLSTQAKPVWANVTGWRFEIGRKQMGAPEYLRITYRYGMFGAANDFLCFEHGGYAAEKASRRWIELTGKREQFTPQTSVEAYERRGELLMPARVQISRDGKYFKVTRLDYAGASDAQAA
jgi:DNA repair protein RadD